MCEDEKIEVSEKENDLEIEPKKDSKENWLNRNSSAIQAVAIVVSVIVTVLLAYFAYKSWVEVQMQRELAHRQFVMAHSPSVRISVAKPIDIQNEQVIIIGDVINKGGPVSNVRTKGILFNFFIDGRPSEFEIIRTIKNQRLYKDEISRYRITIDKPETFELLKLSMERSKKGGLMLYIQVEYTIPSELTIEGIEKEDKIYKILTWMDHAKRFENIRAIYHNQIMTQIEKYDYLTIEDQG